MAIVAHVNMIVSSFRSEKFISEADSVLAYEDAKAAAANACTTTSNGGAATAGEEEKEVEEEINEVLEEEDEDLFSPSKGNVAFASAHDGWAFRLTQFAAMYAVKMGCNAPALERALWGDFTFQPKTRRIVRIKSDQRGRAKPLFVSLALEPLWKAYTACDPGEDHTAILGKIVNGLGLKNIISERAISGSDARAALRTVLRTWLPLSEAVLGMAAQHLPSPAAAAPLRVHRLLPPRKDALKGLEETREVRAALDAVEAAVASCDASEDAPAVVYVSKMVAVPASALPRCIGEPGPANPNEERFLAFGRVFSGVVHAGQTVHVLPSTYNPADLSSERQLATITSLYLMMGRGLERLSRVPAGNVLAIAGLDRSILKTATVTSSPLCRPLAPLLFQSAAIVRVAVEPAHPGDMQALVEGLRLLHRADPLVQVSVQENGEHVVAAAGEVHLETCVKDLRERFAKVELLVSPPLVAFRETVVAPEGEESEAAAGAKKAMTVVQVSTPSGACTIRVRASPLPAAMASVLDQNADILKNTFARQSGGAATSNNDDDDVGGGGAAGATGNLSTLGDRLRSIALENKDEFSWLDAALSRIWLLGPKRFGPNFLLSCLTPGSNQLPSLWDVAPQHVVKMAKQQQGRAPTAFVLPQTAATVSDMNGGGGSGGGGGSAAQQHVAEADKITRVEQEEALASASFLHLPLQLGSVEISQRLGLGEKTLSSQSSSLDDAKSAEAAHAATLASQLASLNLKHMTSSNGGDAPENTVEQQLLPLEVAQHVQQSVESGIASGFELATAAGPLCDEPMWGLSFQIEARLNLSISLSAPCDNEEERSGGGDGGGGGGGESAPTLSFLEDVYGPCSGQVTSAVRHAVRQAVLEAGPRLAEAAFLCEITTSSEGLSAVYAVLGRRRSRVLREEMREGSDLFTIHAYLPAEASFGFADELRRRSSGAASASMMLSHWERLGVDPFFMPLTEEEREEFGEEGQGVGAPNLAKRLIDSVRKRKGLAVEQKVVDSATRQRTRARKV